MKIYNRDKTQELKETEIDYTIGKLVDDKIATIHHEATEATVAKTAREQYDERKAAGEAVEEIKGKLYRVTATYKNGGMDVEEITDIAAVPAKEAYDEYEDIKVYVPFTTDELREIANRKRHAELKAELAKIKEDIEQEVFGLVRNDYAAKKARAAEIVNELRVLEGKEPREIMEVI